MPRSTSMPMIPAGRASRSALERGHRQLAPTDDQGLTAGRGGDNVRAAHPAADAGRAPEARPGTDEAANSVPRPPESSRVGIAGNGATAASTTGVAKPGSRGSTERLEAGGSGGEPRIEGRVVRLHEEELVSGEVDDHAAVGCRCWGLRMPPTPQPGNGLGAGMATTSRRVRLARHRARAPRPRRSSSAWWRRCDPSLLPGLSGQADLVDELPVEEMDLRAGVQHEARHDPADRPDHERRVLGPAIGDVEDDRHPGEDPGRGGIGHRDAPMSGANRPPTPRAAWAAERSAV